MKDREKTEVGARGRYGWRGVLRMVYALPLIFSACPGVAVAAGAKSVVPAEQRQATERPAAFLEFQRILRGYPDLMMSPKRWQIVRKAGKTPKQFEKDVATCVVNENESGFHRAENGEYAGVVQEMKVLRLAVNRVSEKAEVLHDALLHFARKSVQTAQIQHATVEDTVLCAAAAEKACQDFSLVVLRMFARDLLAFRCHAAWLEQGTHDGTPNQAPRSISVSQYLSCNGNNMEIVTYTANARLLWTRQVEMVENCLFALNDFQEDSSYYEEPICRAAWLAPRRSAEKTMAALRQEWARVQTAYEGYMEAWEESFAPDPAYSGSGAPYWRADMCMHMLSHWEELVGYMLYHNKAKTPEVNEDCFLLALPGKEADNFATVYINKLAEAVKQMAGEEVNESLDIQTATGGLREHVARLYDARMRCAIAGISCEFYGDKKRIVEETDKARKLIQEKMLQDITEMSIVSSAKAEAEKSQGGYDSFGYLGLRRKQMRLMVSEIGKSYELPWNSEPFSGEKNPDAPEFSDTHVKRIQDLLEETDAAWDWYRRSWDYLLCNLPGVDSEKHECRLHAQREQWLHFLYSRAWLRN